VVTPDLYTHGHHEPVLRSHRWRTAENSAAYLLPQLHRGMSLLDVDYRLATEAELADVAGSWRQWAAEPDGVFVVVHGEVVARA
jgi:hypothetical protein